MGAEVRYGEREPVIWSTILFFFSSTAGWESTEKRFKCKFQEPVTRFATVNAAQGADRGRGLNHKLNR